MACKTSSLPLAGSRLRAIIICCLTPSYASADKTDDYIDRVMTERQIPGLQLAVVRSGRTVKTGNYGLSNLQDSVSVTGETLFPINSMTKAFTGVAIMQLAQDDRLSIDDTIGTYLLGMLIDKLSEQPFTQFITDQQLQPLKMTKTAEAGFDYYDYVVAHQARQYHFDGEGRLHTLHVEFAPFLRTAAGMTSNATELATYATALQQGKLLTPESLKAMWTATILSNGKTAGFSDLENGYALGWQVIGRDEHPAVSASGGNATSLVIYPEDELIVVILTNLVGALPIQFADDVASFYFAGSQ